MTAYFTGVYICKNLKIIIFINFFARKMYGIDLLKNLIYNSKQNIKRE